MFKPEVRNKARQMLGIQYEPHGPSQLSFTSHRSNSSSSSCSSYDQLPSPSSSLPSIPSSPATSAPSKNEVFDKLRKIVPVLRTKPKPLHSIMAAVSDAMMEEEGMENDEKPSPVQDQLLSQEPALPLDLQSVDITAFKILIRSQPLNFSEKLF